MFTRVRTFLLLALVLMACSPASHSIQVQTDAPAHADAAVDETPGPGDEADAAHDASVEHDRDSAVPTDPLPEEQRPKVIIMIGDGMGRGQLEAASLFAHGEAGKLFMQTLPQRGELTTGGPSGITDSSAAATVMATGVYTYNGWVGIDRAGAPVETLVELAQREGLGTGIVSTAALPHATPASFSAHDPSRGNYVAIADDQIMQTRPDVMLGGGARYFYAGADTARTDAGLETQITSAGYRIVQSAAELAGAAALPKGRLFGAFASEHMTFTRQRTATSTEPTLTQMSLAALDTLALHPRGFFLMIEGARIDMASHGNDLENAVGETLAFDDAIQAVAEWARAEGDVTLMVTADHECGGLEVVTPRAQGTFPAVSWRWGSHTNARVDVFAEGPGSEVFGGALRDHRWIHAVAASRLTRAPLVEPGREPMPDGHLADLRHEAARQTLPSSFDPARARLDALRVDANEYGLYVGIEGLFTWDENAVLLMLDVDYGMDTGFAGLRGSLSDVDGRVDALLSASNVTAGSLSGFGADFALVSLGGADPQLGQLLTNGGLRGLRAPYGAADDLGWYNAAINFGEHVRTRASLLAVPGEGLEMFVPWQRLYPELMGKVPAGARIAMSALLVNSDGGYSSNQALPPFPAGTPNPARNVITLPGLAVFEVDDDADGVADGTRAPTLVLPAP